jgi:tRNA-intron endonuclease
MLLVPRMTRSTMLSENTDAFLNVAPLSFLTKHRARKGKASSGVHWNAMDDTGAGAPARKESVLGRLSGERVLLPSSDPARDLANSSRFGTILAGGKVQLSLLEALYLEEKGKIIVTDAHGRRLSHEQLLAKGKRQEKAFWVKYCAFRDLRTRGYIVKTALKFGADFRVYDRGVKPGEDHARWIVYPVHESAHLTWYEFAAKNRVAHSTKKRLLIAIVDDEGDVTYYEIKWLRP